MSDAKPAPRRKSGSVHSGKNQAKNRPAHRPEGFSATYIEEARLMYQEGMTDAEVADVFGVKPMTLSVWAKKHPEFRAVIKLGKEAADNRVERSLFQRACGYTYKTQKAMIVDKSVEIVEYDEHVLPETTACIFWLKNRRPDLWRDVNKVEHGRAGEFSKLSDADLARALLEEVEMISAMRELNPNSNGNGVQKAVAPVPAKSSGTLN